jgi:hypothetical protein
MDIKKAGIQPAPYIKYETMYYGVILPTKLNALLSQAA